MSKSKQPLQAQLARRLGYQFTQPDLLLTALTHRSASANNNERLEFLGDGLLNCIIAAALFKLRPDLPEGDLSRMRASLVRESTLAEVATELELGGCIILGPGESGSHRRASVLADTFEALLGAIYVDAGFEAVSKVVHACFARRLQNLPESDTLKDPKTRLQEYLQGRSMALPEYQLIRASGPAHQRHFVVACDVTESSWSARGEGSSRRKAEQAAAAAMLEKYGNV